MKALERVISKRGNNRGKVIIEGYLEKQGKHSKDYKRRWFVLYLNNTLVSYDNPTQKNEEQIVNEINLYEVNDIAKKPNNELHLITSKRIYKLKCNESEMYNHWSNHLRIRTKPNVMHEGWLYKKGDILKTWTLRYFMLCEYEMHFELRYYDQDLTKYKGHINCDNIQKVNILPDDSSKQKYGKDKMLELVTKDKIYLLAAGDLTRQTIWYKKLKQVLFGDDLSFFENVIVVDHGEEFQNQILDGKQEEFETDEDDKDDDDMKSNTKKQNYTSEIIEYKKLCEQNPVDIDINLQLAVFYHLQGRTDEAESQYISCLCFEPLHIKTIQCLLQLYKEKGQYEIAQKYASDLIKKYPQNAEYNAEYAVIMYHLKKYEVALEYSKKVKELVKCTRYHRLYLYCLIALKKWDEAQIECEKMMKRTSNIMVKVKYLRILRHQNKCDEGIDFFNNLDDKYQSDAKIMNAFGELLMNQNKYDLAEKYFKNATEIKPENKTYRKNYANILKKLNKNKIYISFVIDDDDGDGDNNDDYIDEVEGMLVDTNNRGDDNENIKVIENTKGNIIENQNANQTPKILTGYQTNGKESDSDDMYTNNKNQNDIKKWLQETVQLPQYFNLFIENGFEFMDGIKDITQKDLNEIGIDKLGHRKRIFKYIQTLKDDDGIQQQEGTDGATEIE